MHSLQILNTRIFVISSTAARSVLPRPTVKFGIDAGGRCTDIDIFVRHDPESILSQDTRTDRKYHAFPVADWGGTPVRIIIQRLYKNSSTGRHAHPAPIEESYACLAGSASSHGIDMVPGVLVHIPPNHVHPIRTIGGVLNVISIAPHNETTTQKITDAPGIEGCYGCQIQ